MATVRILADHTGEWMAGDIITDAPSGLVNMAIQGTRNASTGERVAELVDDVGGNGGENPKSEAAASDEEELRRAYETEIAEMRLAHEAEVARLQLELELARTSKPVESPADVTTEMDDGGEKGKATRKRAEHAQ